MLTFCYENIYTNLSGKGEGMDIDIIVEESRDFDKYYADKTIIKVWDIELPVIDIDDLIEMKEGVARPKDKLDIEALLKLKTL